MKLPSGRELSPRIMKKFKLGRKWFADHIALHGQGLIMVVELGHEGEFRQAFSAEIHPDVLNDATKGTVRNLQGHTITRSNGLMDTSQISCPKTHVIHPEIFPGTAKYPVEDWELQEEPHMAQKSWIKLCIRLAA